MNRTTLIAFVAITACLFHSAADAQRVSTKKLLAAANLFRSSVVQFEKVVVSTYGIVRSDERVVDKFEESTLKVVNAAKNPRLVTRLRNEYTKSLVLQEKAFQSIFGRYTQNNKLERAYEYVLYSQALFEREYQAHLDNPRNGNRVTRLPRPSKAFTQVAN